MAEPAGRDAVRGMRPAVGVHLATSARCDPADSSRSVDYWRGALSPGSRRRASPPRFAPELTPVRGLLLVRVGRVPSGDARLAVAIDAARFRHYEGQRVALEPPIGDDVRAALAAMGHVLIEQPTIVFGGAQVIVRLPRAFAAGSDPRKDGMAVGY